MIRIAFVLLLSVQVAGTPCLKAAEPQSTLDTATDKKALEKRIKKVEDEIARMKRGHVVIGQVVVENQDPPENVMCQMEILKGGYFATAIVDFSRPLTFRMHQYAPLDLDLEARIGDQQGPIFDLGVVKMRRLIPADLLNVEGQLELEGAGNPARATVTMSLSQGPANSPTNGTEGRPHWPAPVELRVNDTGAFRGESLSPANYYCQVKAEGYVDKSFSVEMKPRERNKLGTIKLEKPRRVELEFIVSKEGPFDPENVKKITVSGGTRWKAVPDIYGWDLEFKQIDKKVCFNYNYGPCFLEVLGEGELKDFLDTNELNIQDFPRDLAIEDGHVYLLNQAHWKRKVLLRAKLKPLE